MKKRILKIMTPVLQPMYRWYTSKQRIYRYHEIRVRVSPGVFYPRFLISTRIFLEFTSRLNIRGKSLLEIGSGSGILALLAASKGAFVTASDINPVAISDIYYNSDYNGLTLNIVESDLFDWIRPVAFDFILVAPPYYPKDPINLSESAWYCGKDFQFFRRFFVGLSKYCCEASKIYMILSEDCNIKVISEIAGESGFAMEVAEKKRRMGELNFVFRVFHNSDGRKSV